MVEVSLGKIQDAWPEFVEREHANFDIWRGKIGFVDPKDGFNHDEILREPPGKFLQSLLEATSGSILRDQWTYLANLEELFVRSRQWGKDFVSVLASMHEVPSEIWNAVFQYWGRTLKQIEDWEWILSEVENLPEKPTIFSGIAYMISHGIFKPDLAASEAVVLRAYALMDKAWCICSKSEEKPDDSFCDWLTSSINHVGGWIGEFWFRYCEHLRFRDGDRWLGIPLSLKKRIIEALSGHNKIQVYSRIALTPYIAYFLNWDTDFTVEHFIPLLNWRRNPVTAQQTWSVLLHYRHNTSVDLEMRLLPHYLELAEYMLVMLKDTAEKSDQLAFDDQAVRNLGGYLAIIAMRGAENPVQSGFFKDFLARLPKKAAESLAHSMGGYLKDSQPEEADQIWNKWMKEYLEARIEGFPLALNPEESKEIAAWCPYFGQSFPEAVNLVLKMQITGVAGSLTVKNLLAGSLPEKFPKQTCIYAIAVMKADKYPYGPNEYSQLLEKLKEPLSGTPELAELEGQIYLRG